MSWLSRLANAFRASRVDRELDEELRFHLEARAADLMRQGLARDQAERQAERRLGNELRLREQSRELKLLPWLESVLQDVRFGARTLRRNGAVSTAAILSLALALGACAAAFSLMDALILRPLPVRDPDRLVYLVHGNRDDGMSVFSYPAFAWIRDSARAKVDVFATSLQSQRQSVLPDSGGEEEKLRVQFVTGDTFDLLGVTPALGRLLRRADDQRPGGHPVAVLSHGFWMARFGGSKEILGQSIEVEQRSYQIIGVTREGFTGTEPGIRTDFWVSAMMWSAPALTNPQWGWLRVWGRLHPGVTREEARTLLEHAFTTHVLALGPSLPGGAPRDRLGPVAPTLRLNAGAGGASDLREDFQRPLLILAAVVALVLLIACSNIANLLVARAAARDREMALRVSIGGGRGRLIQHILIESSLLTASACLLGLVFARAAAPVIVAMLAPAASPAHLDLRLDGRLILFVTGLGALATLLFGLAPALRSSSVSPSSVLASGGGWQSSRLGLLQPLVAAQVAFSLTVLFVSGMLLVSFGRLSRLDLGFSRSGVVLLTVETRASSPAERGQVAGRQVLEHVRQLTDVEAASLSGWALFRGWSWGDWVRIPGGGAVHSSFLAVSPGFFRTMRIPLLEGRDFVPHDLEPDAPKGVIVNDLFAKRAFPGERALGKMVDLDAGQASIVGVVGNARDRDVRQPSPFLYMLHRDATGALAVRTHGDPLLLAPRLRSEVLRVHPSLRVTDVTLQSTLVDNTLLRERLLALLSGFFGIVGLVLAAVGLYGVLSYFVVRRTREIGIRLALGARRQAVIGSVLAHVALALLLGIAAGLAAGVYAARFVAPLLFEVEPLDFWSLALPVAALLLSAALAAVPPVRRAVRMDPVAALRYE